MTMDGVEWWMSVDEYASLDYPSKKERDFGQTVIEHLKVVFECDYIVCKCQQCCCFQ